MGTSRRLPLRKLTRSTLQHAVLVVGSLVFSVPFIWLVSTSCKVPEELYPPRWVPEIPPRVVTSPYTSIRGTDIPAKPALVRDADWERLRLPIQEAITAQIVSMAGQLPAFYGPYLREPALAEAVMALLMRRVPDELFEKVEDVGAAWFASNTTPPLVRDVFDRVYRRMELADVVFHGWDVSTETPCDGNHFPWERVDGDATLIPRFDGLPEPGVEVAYSFESADTFAVRIELPLKMAPDNLKKVVVKNRGDRSWHPLWATLEFAGRRYEASEAAYLRTDRWQDITYQIASDEDSSIMMKTWLRLDPAGTSGFAEPGRLRLTLRANYNSRSLASYNKYLMNFREVLRMVPVTAYLRNSVYLVLMNIIGQVLGSSLVAFAFARLRWPGRDFYFLLVLATLMVPAQVTMIPVFLIFKVLGWYNTLKPLWVGSFFGGAFYIFLLRQFMRGIPRDLEDSARIDGCGYPGIFARIILPLSKPAVATIGIFTFLGVWNDFMGPLIYLNDQRLYPLSLGLFALQVFQASSYGLMMAASVLMTVPVIVLFFAAQRQFIQGITLTGLKG